MEGGTDIVPALFNIVKMKRYDFLTKMRMLLLPLLVLCSCEPEGREEGGDGLSGTLPTRTETA